MNKKILYSSIVLAALFIITVGWYFYSLRIKQSDNQTPAIVNSSEQNKEASSVIPNFHLFNSTFPNQLTYSQQIPDFLKEILSFEPGKTGDPFPNSQLTLKFSNTSQPDNDFAASSLAVFDVTDWLAQDTRYDKFGSPATVTVKQKSDHYTNLENLRQSREALNFKQCTFGFFDPKCYGKRYDYLESHDQKLVGYTSLEVSHQSFEYAPYVNFEMVGTINNRKIYITGTIQIYDKMRLDLNRPDIPTSQTQAAIDKLSNQLSGDTKEIYDQIVTSLESIKVSL